MLLVLCRGGTVSDAGGGGSSAAGVAVAGKERPAACPKADKKTHIYREY